MAEGGNGSGGGMMILYASPTIDSCTFEGNTSSKGGGMYMWQSDPRISNSTFQDNTSGVGGGIMNRKSTAAELTNCVFRNNTATNGGGGIWNCAGDSTLINCLFVGNSAAKGGGMVAEGGSQTTMSNCTFEGNSAPDGGGGLCNQSSFKDDDNDGIDDGGGQSTIAVTNCIFWGNSSDVGGADDLYNEPPGTNPAHPDNPYIRTYPVISYTVLAGCENIEDSVCEERILAEDPLFADAGSGDFHLQANSPCIDEGDSSAVWVNTDLDGNDRIVGDGVEMGVYENQ